MALISSRSSSSWYQFILVLFLCFLGLTSASTFFSDGIFHSSGASTRTLLQATKNYCSVDFEHANYTGLISECKGPDYPPAVCCEAFKELACPYSNEINDLSTNCATTMFSYIYLYGKFPPGYFANECPGYNGLDCSSVPQAAELLAAELAKSTSNRATFLVAAVSTISLLQLL